MDIKEGCTNKNEHFIKESEAWDTERLSSITSMK
jgi:hypothetical protein